MNYEDIKKLIDDMGDSKLDSLDIEFPDGIKIKMKKNEAVVKQVVNNSCAETQTNLNQVTDNKTDVEMKEEETLNIVTSPMVGTFYTSPSPKEEPYVKVGDKVKKGDVLCVVEAMKLMNEIESEFEGEIVEICVHNEQMVDYGMPLFKIK